MKTTSLLLPLLALAPYLYGEQTDYSALKNWSKQSTTLEHDIDLFFVHPTTYGPATDGAPLNASLDNTALNSKTDQDVINVMTSIFSEHCNLFAPRYQQMSISVLSFPEDKQEPYLKIAKQDVQAAFDYYLKFLNQGRPYILASHSQGSMMIKLILTEQPDVIDRSQLVAAYLIGYTITDEDLIQMKLNLSTVPDDLGTVITWNTVEPNSPSPVLLPNARCVNPLSWSTNLVAISDQNHLGAQIYISPEKTLSVPHFTSATIASNGALEIPAVDPEIKNQLRLPMGEGCYHVYDYDFFYENTKQNVTLRCKKYLQKIRAD